MSARDPETIAREETFKEKRKDGKANYVNRDTPQAGKTIYVHGFGVDEPTLRTGFSIFGNILNINAETDKKYINIRRLSLQLLPIVFNLFINCFHPKTRIVLKDLLFEPNLRYFYALLIADYSEECIPLKLR